MTEPHTQPWLRQALRGEYKPRSAPKCPRCLNPMTFDRVEAHNFVYKCQEHQLERAVARGDARVLEVCDDADALAGAWERVATLERALREIRGEAYYGLERMSEAGVILTIEGIARRALGLPMAPWTLASDELGVADGH